MRRMRGKHAAGARRFSIVALVAAGLVLVLAGAAFAGFRYERTNSDRLLPGIRVDGIDVGGMTRSQAERALLTRLHGVEDRPLEVTLGGRAWNESAGSLGARVDLGAALDQAFTISRTFGWASRLYHRLLHRSVHGSIGLPISYDRTAVGRFVARVASQVQAQPVNASLDLKDGRLVVQRARPGRALAIAAARRAVLAAVKTGQDSVALRVRSIQPAVGEDDVGMTIIVRRSQSRLYLYSGTRLVKSYPVATGQLGIYDTPEGHFQIINKRINPTWVNPALDSWGRDEPAIVPPGPDNPLGTRALDLSAPGIRIHGTPDDSSIGHYASHGCIRMHIPDSEDLFGRVDVGTRVIIAW